MAINDIVQTIAEARVDARSLSEFVFKPAGFKVARRLAPTIDTLQFYINRFNALDGDFRSSVSTAVSSLNNSVAEAEGKVAYIETTVQDAINNTAIEGGVLADTFLTVAPNNKISTPVNQRALTAAIIGETYYASLNGFVKTAASDVSKGIINSDAWDALKTKLKQGDTVVFDAGHYNFAREIVAPVLMFIKGAGRHGTYLNFTACNGIERRARGVGISGVHISGTKTPELALDPDNLIFGNIGLWDLYEAPSFSGYSRMDDVHITGFDTGKVNYAGAGEIWGGAYSDSYSVFIQRNRIGCVHLNGSTNETYFGGTVSANTEIGIWSKAVKDGVTTYNNIKFIGTIIEGNGNADYAGGYSAANRSNCNIYSYGDSWVYLIGCYLEKVWNLAEHGGQIIKQGCYHHGNVVDATIDGSITNDGISWGEGYKLQPYPVVGAWLKAISGGSSVVQGSLPSSVLMQASSKRTEYSFKTSPLRIGGSIISNNIGGMTVDLEYKIKSGFTANPNLRLVVTVRLYAKDGSFAGLRTFSTEQLSRVTSKPTSVSASTVIRTRTPNISWYLNDGSVLDHFELVINATNGEAEANFEADPLEVEIYGFGVELYSLQNIPTGEVKFNEGLTYQRPLLTATDKGYQYYDTEKGLMQTWDGASWKNPRVELAYVTTDNLLDINHEINTKDKTQGRMVFNTVNTTMYFAVGALAYNSWKAIDSTTSLKPV